MKFRIGLIAFIIMIVVIVINIASCGDRRVKAELEAYIGKRLSKCYEDVIKIIEESGFSYELVDYYYTSKEVVYTEAEISDEDWLYENEIVSVNVNNKHVELKIGGYGTTEYYEIIKNSNN